MKILFIGGTGRLSKDSAVLATEKGYDVFLLVRGTKERKTFIQEKQCVIYGDIQNNPEDCKMKLSAYHFDVVADFLAYNKLQLMSHLSILDGKYQQYIFISSATVYDDYGDELITEESSMGKSKWDYAQNKYECEKYIKKYFETKESTYTIVRPYVTYGETRVPFPIVPLNNAFEWSFIDRILHDQRIVVFDGGQTVTTITHTRDFAKGLVGLFLNQRAYGEAFHITGDKCVTLKEVVDFIGELVNKEIQICDVSQEQLYTNIPYYKELLIEDKGKTRRFCNDKICSVVTDMSFDVSLKDGLMEMIDFYDSHPERKKIDYKWMAEIDRLCWKECHFANKRKYQFTNRADKVLYYTERYPLLKRIRMIRHSIGRWIKGN